MSKLIVNSAEEFTSYIGKELGVSGYHKITQEQINKFAEATLDYQWIHVDVEKAKKESPFGTTISHGYLNLSILPFLWDQIIQVNNIKMLINYGIDKLKFGQAVTVDSEVRVKASLKSFVQLRNIYKAEVSARLEIKGSKKPAFDMVVIFLYEFE